MTSKLFDELIKKRGVTRDFLEPKYEDLADPAQIQDMDKAADRIIKAGARKEKVIIYGDYDADGVTAATIMREILKWAGVEELKTILPDRFTDGYGMSKKVVHEAEKFGASLVVTVDCGSGNSDIINELKNNGVDTVVTDHHEIINEVPVNAVAVVNPRRRDINGNLSKKLIESGQADLAGVGVSFELARFMAMKGIIPDGQEKWMLDLVLIGTMCDSMKITKENRILTYYGLIVLKKTKRIGIKELLKKSKVKEIDTETINFRIGPRLNAAGRIQSATRALELLQTKDVTVAAKLAEEIEKLNAERKTKQDEAVKEIIKRGISDDPVLVEVGDWHEGVLGIVAGRLVESENKPAFVLTRLKNGELKGSGRSVSGFSMVDGLDACRDLLISGGGHAGACGLRLKEEKLAEFKNGINQYYKSLQIKYVDVKEKPDLSLSKIEGINLDFVREIKKLEPYGLENEEPLFELKDVLVTDVRKMGLDGQHLFVMVRGDDGARMKLVAFFAPKRWFEIELNSRASFLVRLKENEYRDIKSVEAIIEDVTSTL